MANELTYQSIFQGEQIDARLTAVQSLQEALAAVEQAITAKYTKPASGIPETDLDAAVQSALAKARSAVQDLSNYYTKTEIDALLSAVNSQQYVDVTALPTASADTLGKIYLVGPDANNQYARYYTSYDGSAYSWVAAGTTEINLALYATKAELSQLSQEVEGGAKSVSTLIESSPQRIAFSSIAAGYGDTVQIALDSDKGSLNIYLRSESSNLKQVAITWVDNTHGSFVIDLSNAVYANIYNATGKTVTLSGPRQEGLSDYIAKNKNSIDNINSLVLAKKDAIDWSNATIGSSASKDFGYSFNSGTKYTIRISPSDQANNLFIAFDRNGVWSDVTRFDTERKEVLLSYNSEKLRVFANSVSERAVYSIEIFQDESLPALSDAVRSFVFGGSEAPRSDYDSIVQTLDRERIPEPNNALSNETPFIINVSDQNAFDSMQSAFDNAYRQGHHNIKVVITEGRYLHGIDNLTDNTPLLDLNIINDVNTCVSVSGDGDVRIINSSKIYTSDEGEEVPGGYYRVPLKPTMRNSEDSVGTIDFNPTKNYMKESGEIVMPIQDAEYMKGAISAVDAGNRVYKFALSHKDMTAEECADMWVVTTHGWILCVWKVEKIEDGEMYISGTSSCDTAISYLSLDTRNSGRYPRYKIINEPGIGDIFVFGGYLYIKKELKKIYECEGAKFLNITSRTIKHLELSGLSFYGHAAAIDNYYGAASEGVSFINLSGVSFSGFADIHDCSFTGISKSLYAYAVTNVHLHDNHFLVCSPYCAQIVHTSSANSSNIYVERNTFKDCNAIIRESFNLELLCDNLYVSGNEFVNSLSFSVKTGLPPSANLDCRGIIERNTFINDADGILQQHNNLQDGGQIYINTRTSGLIIRDNVFFAPIGESSINGIYLDWGAKNVKMYRNLIAGVSSGHDIYSRAQDSSFPTEIAPYVPDYSSGNLMIYNVMTGTYKFEGQDSEDSGNYKGVNAILRVINKYDNIQNGNQYVEDDVVYHVSFIGEKTISMQYADYRALINFGLSAFVLKHIKYVK